MLRNSTTVEIVDNTQRPTSFVPHTIVISEGSGVAYRFFHLSHLSRGDLQNRSKVKTSDYSLRKRDHNFELPSWHYSLFTNSFVIRCLFKFK